MNVQAGVPDEVAAVEDACRARYPPDRGRGHEGFTDEQGRLVRRWTSEGRRIEAVIATIPEVGLVSLGVVGEEPGPRPT
jgi:hypothetical protein